MARAAPPDLAEIDLLLADLRAEPTLARPRRLARGAVLPGGHLDLQGCALGPAAARRLLAGLGPSLALRGLWLAGNDLGPALAPDLAELLARHPALAHLDLADDALGPRGLAALAPALAAHRGLRSLDLAGDDLDPASTCFLIQVVEETGLHHLALGRPQGPGAANRIDDAAAARWAELLRRDPPLASLGLAGVGLGDRACDALLAALACNTRLARLDLGRPLPPVALARLCSNANRRPPTLAPALARLRRALPPPAEPPPPAPPGLDPADLAACLRVLKTLSQAPAALAAAHPQIAALRRALLRAERDERQADLRSARARRHERREQERRRRREDDRVRTEATEIRRRRRGEDHPALPAGEDPGELHTPRPCYACKRLYTRLHFYYDRLCPACAAESHARRGDRVDLRGRLAIVTGGRIKIGHAVALRLLGWGARVIVTSRFPRDAARRFAAHPEFAGFRERLRIVPLDLRAIPHVEAFAAYLLAREPRVDILINNAAQTVRRPEAYYAPLLADERAALPDALGPLMLDAPELAEAHRRIAALPAALPAAALFPAGSDDGFGQPLDLRPSNSWRLRLDEVDTLELLEVQLINAVAPFVLNARLRPAMARPRLPEGGHDGAAFIVNVSAPEGRFDRMYKSPYHPHTNMAKAALNMMTRTSAEDYASDAIYMTSVDTGWASNENPAPIAAAMQARGFMPPLDLVDAAARVCDPIVRGLRDGELLSGVFLKDFRAISW